MKFPAFEPINLKDQPTSFEVIDIPLTKIEPNKDQPRKIFDETLLNELASSIKKHGVIQPILVKEIDNGKKYQIIAGERRCRAAKISGLEKIPAIIKDYDDARRMAIALIENIQRSNLNPLEEAEAIQSLLEECKMTHSQVAESIGKSRTTVSNLLRLLSLMPQVKNMINSGILEMGHARALLSLSEEKQIEIAEHIVKKSLSVRDTEKLVQRLNIPDNKKINFIDPEFEKKAKQWKDYLSKALSTSVNINFDPYGKGKVVIFFESVEEATWLMANLKVSEPQEVD